MRIVKDTVLVECDAVLRELLLHEHASRPLIMEDVDERHVVVANEPKVLERLDTLVATWTASNSFTLQEDDVDDVDDVTVL